jgi:hypothetical protein
MAGYVNFRVPSKRNRVPLPELKSSKFLYGDTINDGERSSENGLNPLKLLPARFKFTKSPITSSTRAVSKTVSIVAFEIKLVWASWKGQSYKVLRYKPFQSLKL